LPEAILAAYFQPVIEHMGRLEAHGRPATLARLLARIEAEGPKVMSALVRRHFGEISARYLDALQEALPHLPPEQTAERFRFAAAVLTQLFSGNLQLDLIPGHPPSAAGVAERARHAFAFILAGLCSPVIEAETVVSDTAKRSSATRDEVAHRSQRRIAG
jgi:hypothetical protein